MRGEFEKTIQSLRRKNKALKEENAVLIVHWEEEDL
jgi:hypothetical protein